MSLWKGAGTDKTDGDFSLSFCIVLEPCQSEALEFTNRKSIPHRGIMSLAKKKKIQNIYLILNCQMLSSSLFSQPHLFDNLYF